MELSKRQQQILKIVVDEFTRTAEAVGSKKIMHILDQQFSSATIRNEMAYLEELNLLEKTHTSSGRVPSSRGYRYYVSHLMTRNLDQQIVEQLNYLFNSRQLSNEQIIKKSCDIISKLTSLTTVAIESQFQDLRLAHIDIIELSSTKALSVLITNDGEAHKRVIYLDDDISFKDIKSCCQVLNDNLKGQLVSELDQRIENLIPSLSQIANRYEVLVQAILTSVLQRENLVYQSGVQNMLYQPEFYDIDKLQKYMELISDSNIWSELASYDQSISIKIGEENDLYMKDLTIISKAFEMGDQRKGQLTVVGPIRMPYDKVISLLEYLGEELEKLYRR